jgi:predicted XRE-type DNA-binding protein
MEKTLKQREIAAVLGIAQPDVSHLMNGHFRPLHHKGEPYQQVTFAP